MTGAKTSLVVQLVTFALVASAPIFRLVLLELPKKVSGNTSACQRTLNYKPVMNCCYNINSGY